ncbi:hypothetical protein M0R45_029323 [Rubus argutus]|uniref:Uncharacterized protein n=1 Tax=Rubus argutus TaxID=59490 RepID=A0AAW1WBU9_RUBAR
MEKKGLMVSAIESESIDGRQRIRDVLIYQLSNAAPHHCHSPITERRNRSLHHRKAVARLLELVDCGLGLLDEPIDGLAGPVVSEPVLHVAELNGRVSGEQDAVVSQYFGSADLVVAVLAASGP